MALPIVERILGTNDPYTSNYIALTRSLAFSMTVKTVLEAEGYNDYVEKEYKILVDQYRPETWRYYLHLSGQYHQVDVPMKLISRDNRKEITLTRELLQSHIETRNELNKYGALYDEMVRKYPEQRLLLISMMATNELPSLEDIIYRSKEWTIIGYNADLIERRETNVIDHLQQRLYNYSHTGLIAHYRHSNEYYLASMMSRLYLFIYSNLLAIRLRNARTVRVHSYYMLNYFASMHSIDLAYDSLDEWQRMNLYRNLTYYNSHAGKNEIFEQLVEVLMTRKNITVVNYIYKQSNKLRGNLLTDYAYFQELLNKENFVFDRTPHDFEMLRAKEIAIQPKNVKEYDFNEDDIDIRMALSTTSEVKTKDLEINLQDDTNSVEYKLEDVLYDYWAASVHLGYNNALVTVIDPISGKELELVAKDAFKLFSIALHFSLGSRIKNIPDYWCWNVLKVEIPTSKFMFSQVDTPSFAIRKDLEDIRVKVPKFRQMDTTRSFRAFIEEVFQFELGLWIYRGSTGSLKAKTNFMQGVETMHTKLKCHFDNENVNGFLNRVGLPELLEYTDDQAKDLLTLIIKVSTEDVLELAEKNRLTQEAATYVIQKFNSYTTQTLSIYTGNDVVLLDLESPRIDLTVEECESIHPIDTPKEILCMKHDYEEEFRLEDESKFEHKTEEESGIYIVDTTQIVTLSEDDVEGIVDTKVGICMTMETEPHIEITAKLIIDSMNTRDETKWIHVQ